MHDQIEGSHKMPQPLSKAWPAKPIVRPGLGCKRSYGEQRDREAKIAQANSRLRQATTKGHSLAPIVPDSPTPPLGPQIKLASTRQVQHLRCLALSRG